MPTFDFTRSRPIDSATVNHYKYILVSEKGKEINITKKDFDEIKKQLNAINERDIEFMQYIKDHLEFKPGTPAFEEAQKDFYNHQWKVFLKNSKKNYIHKKWTKYNCR